MSLGPRALLDTHPASTVTLDAPLRTADVPAVAAPLMPSDGPARFTHTQLVATATFVAMAALDKFERTVLVTGCWWLVLLSPPTATADAQRCGIRGVAAESAMYRVVGVQLLTNGHLPRRYR